jgi:agmatine deiminase
MTTYRLPAEWEHQDAIQIAFPSKTSDWEAYWEEVVPCYINIIRVISSYQPLIIVCDDKEMVLSYLKQVDMQNIYFVEMPINDTWARDHGAITVQNEEGKFTILDFVFNGWGLKFAADKDNLITANLWNRGVYNSKEKVIADMVLEGGSIESDGIGTILTTAQCLLSPNRNPHLGVEDIEERFKTYFGAERVLWLQNGDLEGDDTDAHIDTLARLCDENTIAYVQCTDISDKHFEPLKAMEKELKNLKTPEGKVYKLVSLPMADAIHAPDDGRRLPATYANFLIMNKVVLVPTYGVQQDNEALEQIKIAFPYHQVEGVDCRALLLQHGSLHCITMQYPKGSINFEQLKAI